jgi:hypothetical protein
MGILKLLPPTVIASPALTLSSEVATPTLAPVIVSRPAAAIRIR